MAGTAGLFDGFFYNSGTYASPTLVKFDGIENLTMNDERNLIPVKIRRHDHEMNLVGQSVKSITFNLMTEPGTTAWDFLYAAYVANTPVEFFMFYKYNDNAGAPTAGDKAWRIHCEISKFPHGQELESVDMNEVELAPSIRLQGTDTVVHEPAIYTAV